MKSENAPKLAALFRGIENPISMDTFDDKLRVQKITYLAQMYGIDLGYSFEWYLRGPYCKQVSEDAHRVLERNVPSNAAGSDAAKIAEFGNVLKPYITDPEWLEIAGSLIYLRNESYAGLQLEDIVGYLIEDLTYGHKNFDESLVRKVIAEMLKAKLFV